MDTFEELQKWGVTYYIIDENSHISIQTSKAQIDILTNPYFGRMLFIDGVLQSSEKDEVLYHQTLVEYSNPRGNVLIAGGAEGATAREVFLSPSPISKVVMVDWDEELVNIMRKEVFCKGVFQNPLLEVINEDIMYYLNKSPDYYDSIIIDLLDPQTEDDIKWLSSVCVLAFTNLRIGGTLVINAGGNYEMMIRLILYIKEGCSCAVEYKTIFIPSFQEPWYLIRICKM